MAHKKDDRLLLGWREWASLPNLNIPAIAVKVDTGARRSSLHAFEIEEFTKDNQPYIRFFVHPLQRRKKPCLPCELAVKTKKTVKSSNGQSEERYVVRTPIQIGSRKWDIDITLTNRDEMSYRMLLGREAMSNTIIDPKKSFCQGKVTRQEARGKYPGEI